MTKGVLNARDPLSPLRYPGGKALLAAYISGVVEEHFLTGCTIYEPYAGGGSVSLELLRLGFVSNAVWVERDPLIYAFWHCVFHDTENICAAIDACPVTMETWQTLQPLRDLTEVDNDEYSLLQLGVAGLFFNRTNFSGIINAGPIGGEAQKSAYKINCRFNKPKLIAQIRRISAFRDRIAINFDDALRYLKKNAGKISTSFAFVYVDPPYYVQGKRLYRYFYDDKAHADLADHLTNQGYPWLLSYDDHPKIRELYARNRVQPIYLDYKVRSSRTARELVISNLEIPPPVYAGEPNAQAIALASP